MKRAFLKTEYRSLRKYMPHIFPLAVALLFCIVMLTPLSRLLPKPERRVSVLAMDTAMELTMYSDEAVLEEAEALIHALDKKLSVTYRGSEIYALNKRGSAELDADALEPVMRALELAERTGGAFDPTIYPVVRAWGFTTHEYRVPSRDELDALLASVDYAKVTADGSKITLPDGAMLDLGGIAKGYTADRLCALLHERGVKSAMLNLGGNVQTIGKKPNGERWRVAVTDPFGGEYAGIVEVEERAVVTSGGYERYFELNGERYCHIIDPATGLPAESGLASVTVVGESGAVCDALSTALFVMGLKRATFFWRQCTDFEAIFITDDGRLFVTEGLADAFSPEGGYAKPIILLRNPV